MIEDIGELTPLDETLDHQIADTFATVAQSDIGWTEKIWGSLARKDGGLQVEFGLGKYHNRNVMDGFGGASRGAEQWTVRASRALSPDLQTPTVGPVRYEIVEPLKKVRFALDRNATQPLAFDIVFEGELPPFFEKRNRLRARNRTAMDVIRYHQPGKLSGWVELEGERHEVGDDWFGFRDHSWGMRGHGVGAHVPDLQPGGGVQDRMKLLWGPSLLTRPDGSKYELMHFLYATGHWQYFSGHVNEVGNEPGSIRQSEIVAMVPNIRFDPVTRAFLGGDYVYTFADGSSRTVQVEPLGPSGFYLRTGLYGGWNGHRHGSWQGDYQEDGEHIADIRQELHRIGQFRDLPVRIMDGDATGYGIQESVYAGLYPELGLTAESDHSSDI